MRSVIALMLLVGTATATGYAPYEHVTTYDGYFRKYSKRYFGVAFDWTQFKAQAVAESRLDPAATSSVGATGLMQIMPRTFEDIRRRNKAIRGGRSSPRWNIAAGIWYDRQQFNVWEAPRPLNDRIKFMFGSYNAGRRSIIRAQAIARQQGLDPNLWRSIESSLSQVTGRRSLETLTYVDRIDEIRETWR